MPVTLRRAELEPVRRSDARTGTPVWTRYIWFSWIESPVRVRDGTGYVGSSDAAKLFAFEARSGKAVWEVDAHGWAWGQPALT
jgi:outer membrane protein assembly factor BamB